jgi:Rrf2 family protein
MLNQTTVTAIQSLLYIALDRRDGPVPPGEIAERLGSSAAYLSKINTQLVKANLLRAHRGMNGGMTLAQAPENISLLQIFEACQGKVLGDYCSEADDPRLVCGFHAAMHDIKVTFTAALERWTLADLARKPLPSPKIRDLVSCRMRYVCPPSCRK